eukprot:snap_masked-scaffold228_size248166-processed-gene-1.7 protein:Tk04324 transcript:snap_masked-scaffold228_size248166-processed-gene-1.7-mRNA-1 annotation:"protein isoforms a h i s isoform x4"
MGTYLDKASAVGLRPPLYGLPPHAAAAAAAGYPYHMLGADQLAAWHHQAAYGLRPGSPYSLPITSSSLSPMSRFSPTGFLGHPGLAAAVAAGSPVGHSMHGQHLPQHMKQEYGHGRGGSHHASDKDHSPSKSGKRDSHIKKPLNAFMLYMKEMRPVVQAECTLKESAAINQILGRRWHALSKEDQAKYYDQARKERQLHMELHPGWTARDNYAKHKKKKRRKEVVRESGSHGDPSGASSMKKCRARFGLDQQDLWCKPCSPGNNGSRNSNNHSLSSGGDDPQLSAATNGNHGSSTGYGSPPQPPSNGYIRPPSSQSLDQGGYPMSQMSSSGSIPEPSPIPMSDFDPVPAPYPPMDEYTLHRPALPSDVIDFSKLVPVPVSGSANTLIAGHLFDDSLPSHHQQQQQQLQYAPPPYYDQMPPNSYEDAGFGSPMSTSLSQHDLLSDMYETAPGSNHMHHASLHGGGLAVDSGKEDFDGSTSTAAYSTEPRYISL